MKKEIDLLSKYPKPNRNIEERVKKKVTEIEILQENLVKIF